MVIKGNDVCSNMVAIFFTRTPPRPWRWVKSSFFFRIWSRCISNKMKSRIQQQGCKYFACRHPHPDPRGWGQKVKFYFFQNMVMLHIKLNGITNAEIWKQIFCPQTPPPPPPPPPPPRRRVGSKGQHSTFSEHGHVAYQIK